MPPRCGHGCGRRPWSRCRLTTPSGARTCAPASGCCRRCPRCGTNSGRWAIATPWPDESTALFLLQNVFGVWPADGVVTDQLRARLHGYAEKAMREAAVHTSWHQPNEEFEAAVHRWLDDVVDGPVGVELTPDSSPNRARTPSATRSARSCWRSPSPAFPTCTRAPNCSTTASSTRQPQACGLCAAAGSARRP